MTPPRPDSGRNMPIDAFFRALAADRGSKAIGVVLSGTASDGTRGPPGDQGRGRHHLRSGVGNREVRQHAAKRHRRRCGGLCTAAGRNRAATGGHRAESTLVSSSGAGRGMRIWPGYSGWCGPPPEWTSRTTSTAPWRGASSAAWLSAGFETLEDYSRELEQNREEATALCENCFITVTAFFREPAVFDELKKTVFPRCSRTGHRTIRSGSGCRDAPRARRLIPLQFA